MRLFSRKRKRCAFCNTTVKKNTEGVIHQFCVNDILGTLSTGGHNNKECVSMEEYDELGIELEDERANARGWKLEVELVKYKMATLNHSMNLLTTWDNKDYMQIATDIINFLKTRGMDIKLSTSNINFSQHGDEKTTLITMLAPYHDRDIVVRITQRKKQL